MNKLLEKMLAGLDGDDFHQLLMAFVEVARERGYAVQVVSGRQFEPTEGEKKLFLKDPIGAIKDYRTRTGSTLKDSRDRMEAATGRSVATWRDQ